jgi:hypothetical protein
MKLMDSGGFVLWCWQESQGLQRIREVLQEAIFSGRDIMARPLSDAAMYYKGEIYNVSRLGCGSSGLIYGTLRQETPSLVSARCCLVPSILIVRHDCQHQVTLLKQLVFINDCWGHRHDPPSSHV